MEKKLYTEFANMTAQQAILKEQEIVFTYLMVYCYNCFIFISYC
jgi:hypothetical protein